MGRILRIELRRSAAVGVAVLSLLIGTALLLSFPGAFVGRWMQLAVAARLMLMVLWPLALAGGAWLGRRDARNRVDELFASTARPRWQRVLPTAAALALMLVTAYALMFLAGAGWVVPTSGYFPVAALGVTAVGALSLVAAGWLGMAAGRAVPRLVTAPVLAVAGIAVAGLLPEWMSSPVYPTDGAEGQPVPAALLLTPVYSGSLDDFQTVMGRVNLTQALWLAALAATGLLLLGAVGRRAVVLAVVPAVLGAAVAVPLLPAGGYHAAAAYDPGAVELVCDDDGPQVCVTRVHAGLLPDIVGPAREALTLLSAKLPDAPTRAVENQQITSWARPDTAPAQPRPPADTLVFEAFPIGGTGGADYSGDVLRSLLLEAAWWQACGSGSVTRDAFLARMVAAAWLTGQPPTLPVEWGPEDGERAASAYQALVGLPESEQQRRMAAARDAALDCRADAFASILPGDTP